jgi:UDP-N-acetyl-D-glucosamine/UDP-N-acetyl-D-galactosamine dehydrogenase
VILIMQKFSLETAKIAIIGLGYVGLPLAVAFGAHYPVVGFGNLPILSGVHP